MFWAMSALIFFTVWISGAQNIAKKRYMKCTFCLGLVGVWYPLEPELTIYKRLVQVSLIFITFSELSETFMSVFK